MRFAQQAPQQVLGCADLQFYRYQESIVLLIDILCEA